MKKVCIKEFVDKECVNKVFIDKVFVDKEFFHKGFVGMECFDKGFVGSEFLDRKVKDDWMRVERVLARRGQLRGLICCLVS